MPVIVAEAVLETAMVATVNVAVFDPAATVTEAGTVALLLLDPKATEVPPGPAAPLRVTVPVEEVPPTTEVGDTLTLDRVAGVIVSVAVKLTVARVAVIVAEEELETAIVLIVNVAVVAPAATVTLAGTVAFAVFEARPTTIPPVGAAPLIVTVP